MTTRIVRSTLLLLVTACSPSQEAARVELDVALDDVALELTTNDFGWTVEVTEVRIAVTDVQFTILGEMHGEIAWLPSWLLGRAWAHPGHYAGGDVTGEMVGNFVFDWLEEPGKPLGTAQMLTGVYHGVNFTFRAADAGDNLAADDPLLGHAAHIAGVASKDGEDVAFTAQLDIDAGAQLVGAPFDDEIAKAHQDTIFLQFFTQDHVDDVSLFDGLDFAALDEDADGKLAIAPGDGSHNVLRRTLQSHVHYHAVAR